MKKRAGVPIGRGLPIVLDTGQGTVDLLIQRGLPLKKPLVIWL